MRRLQTASSPQRALSIPLWILLVFITFLSGFTYLFTAITLFDHYSGFSKENFVDHFAEYRIARSLKWDAITLPHAVDGIGSRAFIFEAHWLSGGSEQFIFPSMEEAQAAYNILILHHAPGPEVGYDSPQ